MADPKFLFTFIQLPVYCSCCWSRIKIIDKVEYKQWWCLDCDIKKRLPDKIEI